MTIYPAIDLRGEVVAFAYSREKPIRRLCTLRIRSSPQLWHTAGASHLHVVDLDGAFSGSSQNLEAVKKILEVEGLSVQLGGGMRNEKIIESASNGTFPGDYRNKSLCRTRMGYLHDQAIWSRPDSGGN